MWDSFVELLRATIFSVAHLCGGSLGGGIFLVSAGARLALMPLTLRLARRTREQQARMAALQPRVEALQRRHAGDLRRFLSERSALYREHDIQLLHPSSLLGLAIQLPIFGGLLAAVQKGLGAKVRFLWVPDLARPDGLLLLAVTALTAWGASSAPPVHGQTASTTPFEMIAVTLTVAFLWAASSAVALSVGAGSLVSVLQNWLLARDTRPGAADV